MLLLTNIKTDGSVLVDTTPKFIYNFNIKSLHVRGEKFTVKQRKEEGKDGKDGKDEWEIKGVEWGETNNGLVDKFI